MPAGRAGRSGGSPRRVEAGDYRVISTAAPTRDERQYHYLWRFWRDLPRAGQFVIYDRTWYGRVLVERVEGFASDWEWQRADDEINDFEDQLVEARRPRREVLAVTSPTRSSSRGSRLALHPPEKVHKITDEDYRNREKWDDYVHRGRRPGAAHVH